MIDGGSNNGRHDDDNDNDDMAGSTFDGGNDSEFIKSPHKNDTVVTLSAATFRAMEDP